MSLIDFSFHSDDTWGVSAAIKPTGGKYRKSKETLQSVRDGVNISWTSDGETLGEVQPAAVKVEGDPHRSSSLAGYTAQG